MTRVVVAAVASAAIVGAVVSPPVVGEAQAAKRSRVVSGWFGYWTSPEDMASIAKSSNGVLGEVNIFWWAFGGADNPICTYGDSGSCQGSSAKPWTNDRFIQARKGLRRQGIKVYASHTDLYSGRRGELSAYLSKKKNRKALSRQFADWAVKAKVHGVDLDWENFAFNDGSATWKATKPRFVKTVRLMSKKLHRVGKRLSVTVPGGYSPDKPGGGYWVYAWKKIAPYVDRLRLMTYDYSWNRPGPIGPQKWARQVVKSAIRQVGSANRKKLYVGVHQYGKAWYARDASDGYVTSGDCKANWEPSGRDGIALSPAGAAGLAKDFGVTPTFDKSSREWTFRYLKGEPGTYLTKEGKKRSLDCDVWKETWYGDTLTAKARGRMVRKLGIGGLAVWNLANTNDDFYPGLAPFTVKK
ncbi:MAG: glycosyl hydrolase family 18 protein [Candidatus Nanopelagicales bacterium]|nr:glycosyl hydrolase family 18 protein [Candidatus Nanopelagicales bacterium]MDZ4249086.1 glycosyl hydrolase family 18 protein [Candidatus Nanopelagicales bacterium]